jgi:regulator of replication initiation timing
MLNEPVDILRKTNQVLATTRAENKKLNLKVATLLKENQLLQVEITSLEKKLKNKLTRPQNQKRNFDKEQVVENNDNTTITTE